MSTVKAVCWTILAFLYCNSFLTLAQECTEHFCQLDISVQRVTVYLNVIPLVMPDSVAIR